MNRLKYQGSGFFGKTKPVRRSQCLIPVFFSEKYKFSRKIPLRQGLLVTLRNVLN
jgi:hypothetical protein